MPRASEIDAQRLAELNCGVRPTRTYIEMTAIDFHRLIRSALPEIPPALGAALTPLGLNARMARAGQLLREHCDWQTFPALCAHPSDTVRGWAAYWLAARSDLTLRQKLLAIRPLADDGHFGVREWAWLALRPEIASQIECALKLLTPWVEDVCPNLRRFAIESTRPRGFWSKHISLLKAQPDLGLVLLEPLRADSARYVQLAVGNWLNDAAKSQPQWVDRLCGRWLRESPCAATRRIAQRAQRSKIRRV